ncbi:MAG: hypothetical protein VCD66_00960 [Alphaproteobacteria bacterium]|jgi:thiol:disulfide interchange protein
MFRRTLLQFAAILALPMPLAPAAAAQAGGETVQYSPEAVSTALAQGRAVLLEFNADW